MIANCKLDFQSASLASFSHGKAADCGGINVAKFNAMSAYPVGPVNPERVIIGGAVSYDIDVVLPRSLQLEAWRQVAQDLPVGYDFVPEVKDDGKSRKLVLDQMGRPVGVFHVRCSAWACERAITMFREFLGDHSQFQRAA
jgi:hypothetical protein